MILETSWISDFALGNFSDRLKEWGKGFLILKSNFCSLPVFTLYVQRDRPLGEKAT
jgi:hypothetical protein